jgi:hypothetical protein
MRRFLNVTRAALVRIFNVLRLAQLQCKFKSNCKIFGPMLLYRCPTHFVDSGVNMAGEEMRVSDTPLNVPIGTSSDLLRCLIVDRYWVQIGFTYGAYPALFP